MPKDVRQESLDLKASKAEINACFKEQALSFKCLDDTGYDYDKCGKVFDNYINCKAFWKAVEDQRKRKGISPSLPPLSERKKIKEEHFKKLEANFVREEK